MKKTYITLSLVIFIASIFCVTNTSAQCTNRYLDSVFVSVDTIFNVVYTDSAGGTGGDSLLLDIYQPAGDSISNRRVIVWAHGGAFFYGTKNDGDMQTLAASFARKGYVCASINYRLAPSVLLLADSNIAFSYVMEAVDDMKAAVRFFRKDAATANLYHIDTSMIFIGGSSAGAITADFLANIDSVNATGAYFQPAITSNGGIEGNSGNSGYSSGVKAVASLAGGVNSLSWISPGNPPTICCQGTADPIVPYDCGGVFSGYLPGQISLFTICGSAAMVPQFMSVGIPTMLVPFAGQGHVPWDNNDTIMHIVDSTVALFFDSIGGCALPAGLNTVDLNERIKLYPVPASDWLHVSITDAAIISGVTLYDYTGRAVWNKKESVGQFDIYTGNMAHGVYYLSAVTALGNKVVAKVIIE